MRRQAFGSVWSIILLGAACWACHSGPGGDQSSNTDKINSSDDSEVASVCSSQETLDNLKSIIFNQMDVSNQTPPVNASYKDQLAAGVKVSLEVPTLDSFDKTTKKVSCSAKVTFTWPNAIVNRLKTISPNGSWTSDTTSGSYSIQPQADHNGLVYSMDGPIYDNTVGSVLTMLRTLAQADADAQAAAAAQKAPPPVSAQSSAVSSATSSGDVSAAGDTSTTNAPQQ